MSEETAVVEAPPAKPAEPVYIMPKPDVGTPVMWFLEGHRQLAHPAIVMQVDMNSVCLSIYRKDSNQLDMRDGVRWCNDPRKPPKEVQDEGTWDYTDHYKDYVKLKKQVADLQKQLAGHAAQLLILNKR
jgi:hypothetical protein